MMQPRTDVSPRGWVAFRLKRYRAGWDGPDARGVRLPAVAIAVGMLAYGHWIVAVLLLAVFAGPWGWSPPAEEGEHTEEGLCLCDACLIDDEDEDDPFAFETAVR
jgi:hypothetical protein